MIQIVINYANNTLIYSTENNTLKSNFFYKIALMYITHYIVKYCDTMFKNMYDLIKSYFELRSEDFIR